MVGLLDLPLELREPILVEVILDTTQKPPDGPLSAELSEDYEVLNTTDSWVNMHRKPLQRHSMPLLQVNQQIRDEVFDLMPRKLGQRADDAKLDFLFVEDSHRHLWGTWLSAPFPTSNLNTLHAEIRSFQIFNSITLPLIHFRHPIANVGQDCKTWVDSQCAAKLLNFLVDFLQPRKGEVSMYTNQRAEGAAGSQIANRTIQDLAINIPFEPDQQESIETRVRCLWCTSANAAVSSNDVHRSILSGRRAALILAQSLHNQLLHIFETPPTGWPLVNFSRIIFEAIGTIHLKVAGRPFASIDLSEILAKIPRSEEWNENGVSRAEFFQWKRLAEERRKTAGFTMVKSSVQEHELVGSAGIMAGMLSTRFQGLVRKVTMFSEKVAPFTRIPAVNERVAFTGKAVFFKEDGSSLPGNATFYEPTLVPMMPVVFTRWWTVSPLSDGHEMNREEKHIKEQPKDGEIVLFKGESMLFRDRWIENSILSGEATFYGPAEEGRKEQSGAIEVDSPHVGDHPAKFRT